MGDQPQVDVTSSAECGRLSRWKVEVKSGVERVKLFVVQLEPAGAAVYRILMAVTLIELPD